MPDLQREKFIAEMERCKVAIRQTTSPFLKKDYRKALKRMKAELAEYDRFHNGC